MVKVPEHLGKLMSQWRNGFIAFPQEYIQWHKEQAEASLKTEFADYIIHHQFLADDVWADGFQVVHAIVEDKHHRLFKVKWSDNQHWYVERCGWCLIDPKLGILN